jgi:WS/DGAT/MGAT family acyltransferase
MNRLKPLDMAFLLLERSNRQMHMTAYQMFKIPARQKAGFVARLVKTFRNSEVAAPFNQKLEWLGRDVASWQTITPDLAYHVRHLAVPAPGTRGQFYELVSFLNTPLLDRDQPLWECYIIDGIENNHIAIMVKVHHALIDGGGALKLFRAAMSTRASDKAIRAIWMPNEKKDSRKKRSRAREPQLKQLLSSLGRLPADVMDAGTQFAKLGAQRLKLSSRESARPFGAPKTLFNNMPRSSARRYANCEFSLADIKAIARKTDTTINDVVTAIIDDALHQYLKDANASIDVPLVSLMAMSLRTAEDEAGGNQVSVELVPMGQPSATITTRLEQVHHSIKLVKDKSRKLPNAVRQFYSLFIFGSAAISDVSSAFEAIPSANLVISNMVGPQEQLYMGGFPMVAFQGLPIVPPGGGLNITFASVNNIICLAVGAAPEAVNDPYKLIQFIEHGFEKLQKATTRSKRTVPRRKV